MMTNASNFTATTGLQDQQLPAEVTVLSANWFTRSRNYPIFSATWLRYRNQPYIALCLLIAVAPLIALGSQGFDWRPTIVVFLSVLISAFGYTMLGPGLATKVRSRAWSPRREAVALVLAIGLGWGGTFLAEVGIRHAVKLVLLGSPDATLEFRMGAAVVRGPTPDPAKPEQTSAPSATAKVATAPNASSAANKAEAYDRTVEERTQVKKDDVDLDIKLSDRTIWDKIIDWVSTGIILAWVGGGFDLYQYFRQRRKLAEALRQRELNAAKTARNEAELKLSVLAAQVEPHFLFNTLAGVRSAIQSDPVRATAIVDHLVEYLRATIPQLRNDGGSNQGRLGTQTEAVRAYLALMNARIPRLSYSVDVADGLADAPLPPLMLISLVENAVKHGIEPKVGPGRISVQAEQVQSDGGPNLVVSVSDDGVGFGGTTSGSGIGLSNVRERLATMYGNRASLTLKSRAEGGVRAEIQLPIAA